MKKWTAFSVRALIAVSLGALIGSGWLLFENFARTRDRHSFIKIYREDGTLQKEVCFKDGKFVRVTKEYSPEGMLEKEWLNNGGFRRYYKNGKIKYEVIKDRKDFDKHTIKSYYENGKLAIKQVYRRGRLLDKKGKLFNGVYKYFYQDGTVRKEESYKDGKINGPWRQYYKNGNLKCEFIATKENRYMSGKSYYKGSQVESVIEQRADGPVMVKYDLSGNPVSEHNMF